LDKEKYAMITFVDFRRKTVAMGLSFVVIMAASLSAFAFVRETNDSGTAYLYWQDRNVSFNLNEKCSSDVDQTDCYQAVQNSLQEWMGHPCSDLVLNFEGTTSKISVGNDQFNLIVWRESDNPQDPNFWKYDTSVIALTTTSYNTYTGEISDADIEVNGVNYLFSTSGAQDAMDIQNTLAHELGHCIGLGHSTDPTAVMYPTANLGETSKRTPSQDDIDGLCTIYPTGEKTPLTAEQSGTTLNGGCVTTTNSFWDIPTSACLVLLLGFLRICFRRANFG
jgi:predicted Zn-dependent protease